MQHLKTKSLTIGKEKQNFLAQLNYSV